MHGATALNNGFDKMSDIKLDQNTNDLYLNDAKQLVLIDDESNSAEIVGQRCGITMRSVSNGGPVEGEWAFDTTFGFPLFRYLGMVGVPIPAIRQDVRLTIQNLRGVSRVEDADAEYIGAEHKLNARWVVKTDRAERTAGQL